LKAVKYCSAMRQRDLDNNNALLPGKPVKCNVLPHHMTNFADVY
jgi:hypothetical protein